jgi:hypothetical protein
MKSWRDAHKEQHDAIIECPCGSAFKSISRYTHANTKKHKQWEETVGEMISTSASTFLSNNNE